MVSEVVKRLLDFMFDWLLTWLRFLREHSMRTILRPFRYFGIVGASSSRQLTGWAPGTNQPMPYNSRKWNGYDPEELRKAGGLYGLLISSVVPRPIALVTTQNESKQLNCAPFSYFNVVSHDPPLLIIGCNLNGRTNTKKDTLNNIELSGNPHFWISNPQ